MLNNQVTDIFNDLYFAKNDGILYKSLNVFDDNGKFLLRFKVSLECVIIFCT